MLNIHLFPPFKKGGIYIIILTLFLSSCGFKPRGAVTLPPPLHNLYIQTDDPYGQTTRNLKQSLTLSGVHFATTPEEASTVLTILNEDTNQQLLSVGGSQQTRQYNLVLTVTFQIANPQGKIIVPPQSISETRAVTIQSNQILGGSNEVDNLYQGMRRAIIYNIMNRLASKDVNNTLMKNP